MEERKIIPENERQEMYIYKPEFKAQGKFPIRRTYRGKEKTESDIKRISKENMGKKHQSSEEVSPKIIGKVSPKNIPEISSSQSFKEDTNLKSITQSNRESITQKEDDLISNDGWIPLFRKSMESQVFQNEGLWKVWTWCMMKASHTEQWVPIKTGRGKTEVHILPGQFIFGRKTAAKELKMKPPTIQKRMLKLKNMRNCITQSHKHYSLVTLTNWEFYRELQKKGIDKVSGKYQASITYKKNKKEKTNIYGQNFLTFWKAYPNRVSKKKAQEAWNKLEKKENMETLLPTLLNAIEKQKQDKEIKKANGEFAAEWPNPATWLNGRRWEDEIEIEKQDESWDI